MKNLPFLNSAPSDVMWLVPVEDVMVRSVIMLKRRCDAAVIVELIERCDCGDITHHAFPVVDDPETAKGRRLRVRVAPACLIYTYMYIICICICISDGGRPRLLARARIWLLSAGGGSQRRWWLLAGDREPGGPEVSHR